MLILVKAGQALQMVPECNVHVLPGCLERCVLSLSVMGSKSFLPLWHVCNQPPRVQIKIIVYLIHCELISGANITQRTDWGGGGEDE